MKIKGMTTIATLGGAALLAALSSLVMAVKDNPRTVNESPQVRTQSLPTLGGGDSSVGLTEQFRATTAPYSAIAPRVAGKNIYAPFSSATTSNIYTTTLCLIGDTCRTTWPTGGGGGGSGGGTWATTTSSVSGQLINSPLNTTDIVTIGSHSTTTAPFYLDPNVPFAYFNSPILSSSTPIWNRQGTIISAGPNDNNNVLEPTVLFDSSPIIFTGASYVYKMWYTGGFGVTKNTKYAESIDGVHWSTYGTVLAGKIRNSVVKNGSTYYMYVSNNDLSIDRYTSADGITWALGTSGVVASGGGGFDNTNIANSSVYIQNGIWYMLYEASSNGGAVWNLGLATSTDGIAFTKYASNPVINSAGGPSGILKIGSKYYVWAHKAPAGTNLPTDIYRFSSTDLYSWTQTPAAPVFTRHTADEGSLTQTGQVADPYVVAATSSAAVNLYYSASSNGNLASGRLQIKMATARMASTTLVLTNEGDGNIWNEPSRDVLFNTGNVGIGSSSPFVDLSVVGDQYNVGKFTVADSASRNIFSVSNSGQVAVGTNTVDPNSIMTINASSTVSSNQQLVLSNPGVFHTGFCATNTTNCLTDNNAWGMYGGVNTYLWGGGATNQMGAVLGNGVVAFNVRFTDSNLNSATGNTRLTVLNGGNVGIGSTTPYAKLSVDGKGVFNQDVRADFYTATSTKTASTFPYASTTMVTATTASTTNLVISGITGTQCLHSTLGVVSGTGSDCGTGSLATYDAWTHPASLVSATTSSLRMINASTTAASALDALQVGRLATTTITGETTGTSTFAGTLVVGTTALVAKQATTGRVSIATSTYFGTNDGLAVGGSAYFSTLGTLPNAGTGQVPSNLFNNFNNGVGLLLKKTASGTGDYVAVEDSSANPIFYVKSSGNTGIGSSSPTNALTVVGTVQATNFNATSTVATSTLEGALTVLGNALIVQSNSKNVAIGTTTPFAANKVTIASTGQQLTLTDTTSTSAQVNLSTVGNNFFIATSSAATGATSTVPALQLNGQGSTGFGIGTTSTASIGIIDSFASVASTTGLLLEASSKGGCLMLKDVQSTGYTQIYAQAGVLFAKVATSLTTCN